MNHSLEFFYRGCVSARGGAFLIAHSVTAPALYFLSIIAFILLSNSCGDSKLPASLSSQGEIKEFLVVANTRDADPALRYAALEPVISVARKVDELDWLSSQLGIILEKNPQDPYGAYYLMAMANGARETGSNELALDYMQRLLKNYPDLTIKGRSLHLLALREIALHADDSRRAIAAREAMQSQFPDQIDMGRNLYYLATEYKKIGVWERMFDCYEDFLNYPETIIPGIPDAHSRVIDALGFHTSNKTWTVANLEDLVNTIKYAIKTQNVSLLERYKSDNFFFMNWTQDTSDAFTHTPMNLGIFLTNRVRFRSELDDYSNAREAFLWTAGWTWKIPTWYLYFRKIDYPVNPEINGRWEWAGIYFGERL